MEEQHIRPSWDDYFLNLADTVSERATCNRGRSGCVIVKDKQILVTGYVGSPKGLPHCDEVGHLFRKTIHEDGSITQHCVRTVHAEQNAICQAARRGIALDGSTLYCRMTPCRTCAMLIINCGIVRWFANANTTMVPKPKRCSGKWASNWFTSMMKCSNTRDRKGDFSPAENAEDAEDADLRGEKSYTVCVNQQDQRDIYSILSFQQTSQSPTIRQLPQ